ncbi:MULTISPECIES: OadG family protein [Romboutsia]|uniref:Oxaloacetate decarboxylase, gamma chain n=1 Tax=Romboutsia hominis TaxID=1507512 RepID=A0A2P2BRM9_9FIRM|nr:MULTISPECIES: OadG family protein [Romboutsia]MCH1960305.1 OadG family protein [Romboutsia hominis]MCH1969261.1 OadG family protein [Romboutsia hominis]MDB8805105.1 OadG family protein [Romboutsia sp. 1001216sp1]MDB8808732.1 OadG family protein [Romboutsia sp. 1001216sp1]MDB8810750.1 OadG family protein [Romboutsia sp. 1001216sp1]
MNISQLLETLKDPTITLSIGETLLAGVSVALLSMSVVFIILLVITAIIKLLQSEKSQAKLKDSTEKETMTESNEFKKDESIEELVSVITAAIAASTGNSTNNIIVRKISRTNNSKTNWERMTKSTTK